MKKSRRYAVRAGWTADALQATELASMTLLHQSARPDAWRHWFIRAGLHDASCMQGQRYELFSMLVEAARAGLGVALVPRFFVQQELASGELVMPNRLSLSDDRGYWLVYPERKQGAPLLQAFREWLLAAAHQYRAADSMPGASAAG